MMPGIIFLALTPKEPQMPQFSDRFMGCHDAGPAWSRLLFDLRHGSHASLGIFRISGRSAVGSAPGLGPGGREFESLRPDCSFV